MPRYYFHVSATDNGEGHELPGDAAARAEAVATFGEMIRHGAGLAELRMDVTDETGRRVATLTFTLV
jgi:hypothetical protein